MRNKIIALLLGQLCLAFVAMAEPIKYVDMEDFDSWMRAKRAQLRELHTSASELPATLGVEKEQKQKERPAVAEDGPLAEEGIEKVHEERKRAFSKMNRLHSQLRWFPDDQTRLEAALEILELERTLQRSWRVIDHHKETGELLALSEKDEPKPFNPADYREADLIRLRDNARKYISNASKRGYAPEKVAERKELIDIIQTYLDS